MTNASGGGLRRSVRALEHANFRRYFAGQLLSTVGTWMQVTAQVWLVVSITKSGGALGLTAALQFLPALFLSPYAGVIADRIDNRRLLLVTNSLAGLFALALGVLSSSGLLTLHWLYVGAFSIGMSNAFDRAAGPAFVSSLVPAEQLPSAIGLYSVTASASRMVGIAVSGVIIAAWGATACFYLNAASYLLVLASLLALRSAEIAPRLRSGPVRIRDGIRHVRERPLILRTLVVTTVVGIACMNFLILVPAVVKLAFGGGAASFGLAEVFSGAGSTVAGFVVGALRRPDGRTLAGAAVLLGAATVATGLAPTLWTFCVLMFAVGVTATGFMTVSMTIGQLDASPEMRGRVSSLQAMANQGTTPLGSLLAGALISMFSARTAFVAGGVVALFVGAVLVAVEFAAHVPAANPVDVDLAAAYESE